MPASFLLRWTLFGSFGRIAFRGVVEDEDPVVVIPLRRGRKLAVARVRILSNLWPLAVALIVPAGLHGFAGEFVHVDADRTPVRQVGNDKTAVVRTGRLDVVFPIALSRGDDRLVRDKLVPGAKL